MKVTIGQVVDKIVGNDDRLTTQLDYYIGGEHIETSRIKVRNKGLLTTEKRNTLGYQFHYPFEPGDVLFMTKNPYLKKCGQVDFSGICSIATFVLRTKDENILLQDYLAVITQTDSFWNYLEANKSGSVNYFITWKTLEQYEFELPDVAKQKNISEIVFAMEELRSKYENQLLATDELVKSQFIEMFKGGKYPIVKAAEVCGFITKGTTPSANEIYSAPFQDSIPYLKVYNLSFDGSMLFFEEPQYIAREIHEGKLARSKVYPNDVLMNIVGPPLGKFSLVNSDFPEWNINQAIAIFRAKESILPKFLLHALMQPDVLKPFLDKAQGVRQLNFSLEQCRNLEFPLPPIAEQEEFVLFAEQSDKSKMETKKSIENLGKMLKSYLSENVE